MSTLTAATANVKHLFFPLLSDEAFTNLLNEELIFTPLSLFFSFFWAVVVVVVRGMRQTGRPPGAFAAGGPGVSDGTGNEKGEGSAGERARKEGGSRGGVTHGRASFRPSNGCSLLLVAASAPPATAAGCRA